MLTPDQKTAMGDGAAAIREHLWLGTEPPPPPHPHTKRPWSMARELSVWKRLVLHCGCDPDELNGAIANVRSLLPNHDGIPLRLTVFYNSQGYATPLYEQAVALYHNRQHHHKKNERPLPPTVRDILRQVIQ